MVALGSCYWGKRIYRALRGEVLCRVYRYTMPILSMLTRNRLVEVGCCWWYIVIISDTLSVATK